MASGVIWREPEARHCGSNFKVRSQPFISRCVYCKSETRASSLNRLCTDLSALPPTKGLVSSGCVQTLLPYGGSVSAGCVQTLPPCLLRRFCLIWLSTDIITLPSTEVLVTAGCVQTLSPCLLRRLCLIWLSTDLIALPPTEVLSHLVEYRPYCPALYGGFVSSG